MKLSEFIKQKDYEKVMFTVRRHPVTFVPVVLFFIVLLAVPAAIYPVLTQSNLAFLLDNPVYKAAIILLASIYLLSIIMFFYTYFVSFYLDMWIVTNDRLMDINQEGLFARSVAEVDLYQIQDVTSSVEGVFASIFNYGTIMVQTAGPVPKFISNNVRDPNKLREAILDLASEDKKHHNAI